MRLAEVLGPNGPFASHIEGFTPRIQQQVFADAVEKTLREGGVLVAEAGTGTGKTLAYLVPALRSGCKVIISTGTRTLQEQIYFKDLPMVKAALGISAKTAMLKGRGNYLCRHRLAVADITRYSLDREHADSFARVREWAGHASSGDIAEIPGIPEDSPIWPHVTSTPDNCLGHTCAMFDTCHVVRARRQATEADVVVINHHLFFADMALKDEGFGELLPGADAFILDEAHQLPDLASRFFGTSLSSRQLTALLRDTVTQQQIDAPDFSDLAERAGSLALAVAEVCTLLGSTNGRAPWKELADRQRALSALDTLRRDLVALHEALAEAAVRGKGLEHCYKRCGDLLTRLGTVLQVNPQETVRWFEARPSAFTLSVTPLDVANTFRARTERYSNGWVLTSATLAVDNGFTHFAARLGLGDMETLRLDSPFDFARNALLYHPRDMPDPGSKQYVEAVVDTVLPVLEASRGRAFLLFTSHRALRAASTRLMGRCRFPLLTQGSMPKGDLLRQFRALGNAVLLGTASFWEGVDVRGDVLSCVVIDKLPFASPSDPVLRARIESIRGNGGDPFLEYQLPNAVIALKQGVGRLIRDVNDRGVLVLCDPRLTTKSYGRIFLSSLPPMGRTNDPEQVFHFFARREENNPIDVPN